MVIMPFEPPKHGAIFVDKTSSIVNVTSLTVAEDSSVQSFSSLTANEYVPSDKPVKTLPV